LGEATATVMLLKSDYWENLKAKIWHCREVKNGKIFHLTPTVITLQEQTINSTSEIE
jgi:hypothetical protein